MTKLCRLKIYFKQTDMRGLHLTDLGYRPIWVDTKSTVTKGTLTPTPGAETQSPPSQSVRMSAWVSSTSQGFPLTFVFQLPGERVNQNSRSPAGFFTSPHVFILQKENNNNKNMEVKSC